MKVYCCRCRYFTELYSAENEHYEACAKAVEKRIEVPGSHRNAPYVKLVPVEPKEKNKNNDCKDWKARG